MFCFVIFWVLCYVMLCVKKKKKKKKSSSKLDEEGIQVAVCRYMGRPEACDCTDDTCQSCVETHLFINLSEVMLFPYGNPLNRFFFLLKR